MENARSNNQLPIKHCLALIVFSAALFMPMMGRGFVLDDFGHLYVVQHESVQFGLTRASGGPYYAPLAWLSFKIDWLLWGPRPYLWAITNLCLHICNVLLLYAFAARLWHSRIAGWWSAFGFACLYPANVVAVLFIATRAHLLSAFFYLLSMHAALAVARSERRPALSSLITIVAGFLAIFSKEIGSTVLAAVAVVFVYEHLRLGRTRNASARVIVLAGLVGCLAVYLILRSRSGALPIAFSGDPCCSYSPSFNVFLNNLGTYFSRTYGLLVFPALAILLSIFIGARRVNLKSLSGYGVLLSLILFGLAVAPVILLRNVNGIYSYLPGIGAALILGCLARLSDESRPVASLGRQTAILISILLVAGGFAGMTVVLSQKWIRLAETNTEVLNQIKAQQPTVPSHTFVRLTYGKPDIANRFPEGFGDWCFPYALRTMYGDRTIDGAIVRAPNTEERRNEIRFDYFQGVKPLVIKQTEFSPR